MNKRILFVIGNSSVEPLGIMYLAAQLKKNTDYKLDCFKYNNNSKEFYDYIDNFRPNIVALSTTTGQHLSILEAAKIIKENFLHITTVIGGSHPTYFPDVATSKNIDYVIRGEADLIFPKLINKILSGNTPNEKDQSELVLPTNLDDIPFPYRDIVYRYNEYRNNPVKNILTARGCPYQCTYCYSSSYQNLYKGQKIVRYRSAENVLQECLEVKDKYKAKMIFFADDEFSMNVTRLRKIVKLYKKNIKLPFHCQLRIDVLDEERISLLKDAGCVSLTFAIETGNENLRKKLLNRNISNKQIINGAKLLKKYKIKFRAENMIGLPYETDKQRLETLKLNTKIKPDYAWVSLFQPYPMTQLGEECKRHNLCDSSVDVFNEKFSEDSVLKCSKLQKYKLLRFQRLFSLLVEFPILQKILNLLLLFPNLKLLTKLRDKFKMYCYNKRILRY